MMIWDLRLLSSCLPETCFVEVQHHKCVRLNNGSSLGVLIAHVLKITLMGTVSLVAGS
jgi:hypothetical protein